jgi:hypothetical protein
MTQGCKSAFSYAMIASEMLRSTSEANNALGKIVDTPHAGRGHACPGRIQRA